MTAFAPLDVLGVINGRGHDAGRITYLRRLLVAVPVGIGDGENLRTGQTTANDDGNEVSRSVRAREVDRGGRVRAGIQAFMLNERNPRCGRQRVCDEQKQQEAESQSKCKSVRRRGKATASVHHNSRLAGIPSVAKERSDLEVIDE